MGQKKRKKEGKGVYAKNSETDKKKIFLVLDIWLARKKRKDGVRTRERERKQKGRRTSSRYVDKLEGEFAIRLVALSHRPSR